MPTLNSLPFPNGLATREGTRTVLSLMSKLALRSKERLELVND